MYNMMRYSNEPEFYCENLITQLTQIYMYNWRLLNHIATWNWQWWTANICNDLVNKIFNNTYPSLLVNSIYTTSLVHIVKLLTQNTCIQSHIANNVTQSFIPSLPYKPPCLWHEVHELVARLLPWSLVLPWQWSHDPVPWIQMETTLTLSHYTQSPSTGCPGNI